MFGWFKLHLNVWLITSSAYSFTVQMFPLVPIAWEAYKHANAAHIRAKLRPGPERQGAIIMEQLRF
jgi:hypothetical protein